MSEYFAVSAFFIWFRESLELSLVVGVLLNGVRRIGEGRGRWDAQDPDLELRSTLRKHIWWGVWLGTVTVSIPILAWIIPLAENRDRISERGEEIMEGCLALIASILIFCTGPHLLFTSQREIDPSKIPAQYDDEAREEPANSKSEKFHRWLMSFVKPVPNDCYGELRRKRRAKEISRPQWFTKWIGYNLREFLFSGYFWLTFTTVFREALEASLFTYSSTLNIPGTAFPAAVICGLVAGLIPGYVLYLIGHRDAYKPVVIFSMCFLYLFGAGLFSRSVWHFERAQWMLEVGPEVVEEAGDGPGSFKHSTNVWFDQGHNPYIDGGGGWGVFNTLFGWQNAPTIGSVLAYHFYWLAVIGIYCWWYWQLPNSLPHRLWERWQDRKAHRDEDTGEPKIDDDPASDEASAINNNNNNLPQTGVGEPTSQTANGGPSGSSIGSSTDGHLSPNRLGKLPAVETIEMDAYPPRSE